MSDISLDKIESLKEEISIISFIHSEITSRPFVRSEYVVSEAAFVYLENRSEELCKEIDLLEPPQIHPSSPSEAINFEVPSGN